MSLSRGIELTHPRNLRRRQKGICQSFWDSFFRKFCIIYYQRSQISTAHAPGAQKVAAVPVARKVVGVPDGYNTETTNDDGNTWTSKWLGTRRWIIFAPWAHHFHVIVWTAFAHSYRERIIHGQLIIVIINYYDCCCFCFIIYYVLIIPCKYIIDIIITQEKI